MKNLTLIALLFCFSVSLFAQNDIEEYKRRRQQEFTTYKDERLEGLKKYKEEANKKYAEMMQQRWEYFQMQKGIEVPKSPDPVVPPVFEPDDKEPAKTRPQEVKIEGMPAVSKLPKAVSKPKYDLPEVSRELPKSRKIFDFYGTVCTIQYNEEMVFELASNDEYEVSKAWAKLSGGSSNQWLNDCITAKGKYNLCDWAYLKFTQKAAESLFGESDEATLLQAYTLIQSGYKLRIGRGNGKLCLFVPSEYIMYNYSYVAIDGDKYFAIIDDLATEVYIFDANFPEEHLLSLEISQPYLSVSPTESKSFKSRRYQDLSIELETNANLIDFYNDFPRNSSWNLLSKASLSQQVKNKLYPVLREKVKGKTQEEAANILINFVQTAFEYKTDGEQFGYERPFFGDELFFYPYSDCEDRSILYSILVREILKLDVVLLHYEGHLATAVKFTDDVNGDYLLFENDKYIVCDPTYINANIGRTMPNHVGAPVRIIKI